MSLEYTGCRWGKIPPPQWGITASVDRVLRQLEIAEPSSLPDLSRGPALLMACDYSGHHKAASHEAFSFLLCDLQYCWLWDEMRSRTRQSYLRDHRRISFKDLNDRRRRLALKPFLHSADYIPGLLCTVLVHKEFYSNFDLLEVDRQDLPPFLRPWALASVKKLFWVSHLGGLLFAGLSAPGQNLLWFTDEDDIAANAERVTDATSLLAQVTSGYLPHTCGHLRFGTTACDKGDLFLEDIVAIPDLAAGALSELPQVHPKRRISQISMPLRGSVSRKALAIIGWVALGANPTLHKLILAVDQGDSKVKARVRVLDLRLD